MVFSFTVGRAEIWGRELVCLPTEPDVHGKSPYKILHQCGSLCPESSGSLLETENIQHH